MSAKNKLIMVTGHFSPRVNQTPEGVIKDMLRYDGGYIVGDFNVSEHPEIKSQNVFRVLVSCSSFTPERWKSFGLKVEEV
mgnify:CR=1 FL=1|tara:strand:- start:2590 stop:2829 length:240 start_codon:yes stop_codon:yes gene_type:complete